MSRKAAYCYDDDSCGDYEEEYEEYEEYYEEPPVVQSKSPATTSATTATQPVLRKAKKDASGLDTQAVDYDILVDAVSSLRKELGPLIPTDTLVEALRESNYDTNLVSSMLNAKKRSGRPLIIMEANKPTAQSSSPTVDVSPVPKDEIPISNNNTKNEKGAAVGSMKFELGDSVKTKDGKETITMVITGHVDSGKSTILGHILYQLGHYTEAELRKNEKIAVSMNKQSFKFAFLLDQSEEERRRGVTVDAGSQSFETKHKKISLLDAPGHKDFIMNMVTSASQADAAILVVTAQHGEFESGLNHGTADHLQILRILGVDKIIVAVNKMDAVGYSKERFDDIYNALLPVILAHFSIEDILFTIPISGFNGVNLIRTDITSIPWYDGPSLVEAIDMLPVGKRYVDAPLRISVQDVQKNLIYGRIESGKIKKGANIVFYPSVSKVLVSGISLQGMGAVNECCAGALVEISTTSEINMIVKGEVGCYPKLPVKCSSYFKAEVQLFSNVVKALLPGSDLMIGIQSMRLECTVERLISKLIAEGHWSKGMVKCLGKDSQGIVIIKTPHIIAAEPAHVLPSLGRFVIRQEGETVGGGIITEVLQD
eukprot:Tbor_TRINITY_DN5156_c0_g1::TRINITY_DN5156_c0_g1_i1::g.25615::m.25615/K14416/HBS1; elongation factor 1 alpha-like protein